MSQRDRRTNPYPTERYVAAIAVMVAFVLMLYGLHVARGIANVLAGGTFAWPAPEQLFTSVGGLLAGDASSGLSAVPDRTAIASSASLYFWVVVVEVLILAISISLGRLAWKRWGPGRMIGAADPRQVADLLGIERLQRVAPVIRPDLYGKKNRR